ncbi:hypothetical protein O181_045202 [Austropuccinia psidii MF-1]|uniref:Uncharacterized protein n=1 Tax=Austropuccinia psidii MF-1 TaxID=1389203 RepID=A0A9Q3DTD8_9BASI|nr:hypothetical protein [Austropuccinia psidii MF-1]
MLPTLLTILTLAECTPNTAYHPYARGVASQHFLPSLWLQGALPTLLTILMLAECTFDMLLTLLTTLMLAGCPPNMLATLLTILMLAECPPDTAYPYASILHP